MDLTFVAIMLSLMIVILGFVMRDYWICVLGCFLLSGTGVYIIINGMAGESNLITNSIAYVIIGIAIYIGIKGGIDNVNL